MCSVEEKKSRGGCRRKRLRERTASVGKKMGCIVQVGKSRPEPELEESNPFAG